MLEGRNGPLTPSSRADHPPRPTMQFQFDIASNTSPPPPAQQPTESVPELLRQILDVQPQHLAQPLEVQREQLAQARAAAQDAQARWKNLLSRWQKEHPDFSNHC